MIYDTVNGSTTRFRQARGLSGTAYKRHYHTTNTVRSHFRPVDRVVGPDTPDTLLRAPV